MQEQNHNNILEDKALVESLFTKKALDQIEANQQAVPLDYFDAHEKAVLKAIHADKSTARILKFGIYKKMAIAASLLTIAITTYIFIPSNSKKDTIANNFSIQEIPTTEIESYVNTNEVIAEIDWQSEINKEAANIDAITNSIKEDSNNTQP